MHHPIVCMLNVRAYVNFQKHRGQQDRVPRTEISSVDQRMGSGTHVLMGPCIPIPQENALALAMDLKEACSQFGPKEAFSIKNIKREGRSSFLCCR